LEIPADPLSKLLLEWARMIASGWFAAISPSIEQPTSKLVLNPSARIALLNSESTPGTPDGTMTAIFIAPSPMPAVIRLPQRNSAQAALLP
jgi:hypothetical protein